MASEVGEDPAPTDPATTIGGTLPIEQTMARDQTRGVTGEETLALIASRKSTNGARIADQEPVPVFGDYSLIRKLASGGMGVVYLARQESLRRHVALKMILTGDQATRDEIQRFRQEAEAAAQLDHPGIVPVFEVGEQGGQHYFTMGYVEGGSLSARIKARPLPPREAAEMVRLVAEAVGYAHQRGIIHRDLKPSNILLDGDGHPKVTDFGLAKQVSGLSHLTLSGQVMGTPSYMAPEQAAGRVDQVGPSSDIYALGALFYCLATGRPPFQAATPVETLKQVLEQEPVSPRQLNASVGRDLETICLKCLQKEPARRYESALALAEATSGGSWPASRSGRGPSGAWSGSGDGAGAIGWWRSSGGPSCSRC